MSSCRPPVTFKTTKVQLAVLGRSVRESALEGLEESDPTRIVFLFSGLPADFEWRVLRREVVVNAADVLSAMETIHRLLRDARRSTR